MPRDILAERKMGTSQAAAPTWASCSGVYPVVASTRGTFRALANSSRPSRAAGEEKSITASASPVNRAGEVWTGNSRSAAPSTSKPAVISRLGSASHSDATTRPMWPLQPEMIIFSIEFSSFHRSIASTPGGGGNSR